MSAQKTVAVPQFWQQYFGEEITVPIKPSGGYKSILKQNQINLANLQQKKNDLSALEKDVRDNPSKWTAEKTREILDDPENNYTPQERQYLKNHAALQDAIDQMPQKMSNLANEEVNGNIQAELGQGVEITNWDPKNLKYTEDINTEGLKYPNDIWNAENWETVNWDGSSDIDEEEEAEEAEKLEGDFEDL